MMTLERFESLFREHYAALCGFAGKYLRDSDGAEEIVQNTFVKLWERRNDMPDLIAEKAYIYQAVRNACLNELKHEKVKRAFVAHHTADEVSEGDTLEAVELEERIRTSIASMPAGRREVFCLSRFEGLKYQEIAEKLKISIKTVENQMGSAIRHLRTDIADYLTVLFILFGMKN